MLHVRGGKEKGLIRGASLGDGESSCDTVLSMLTRPFLTDRFLQEAETAVRLGIKLWFDLA